MGGCGLEKLPIWGLDRDLTNEERRKRRKWSSGLRGSTCKSPEIGPACVLAAQEVSWLEEHEPDGEIDREEVGGRRGQTHGASAAEGTNVGLFLGCLGQGRQGPISLPGPK